MPDHPSAVLAWGNGTGEASTAFAPFHDAFGVGKGAAARVHRYGAAGTFPT